MKTTLLFCLFPLLLFLVAHADASGETDLKCSKKTIAELGKDITLECYCKPRYDVTHEVLKWKFNQKTFVLAYIGTYDTKHQDPQFKGRAQVSSTERLKDGNFPVRISKVNESDEGTYTCCVGRKTCRVELKVKKEDKQASDGAQGGNIPPPSGGPDTGTISGIGLGVVGAVVLVAVFAAWLIYRNRRTQKPSQESIDLTSTTKNEEGTPSEVNPLTAPS